MSEIYDALRRAQAERERPLATRIRELMPRLLAPRAQAPPVPTLMRTHGAPEADLRALRGAVDRLDTRLSEEMAERDAKLREELRRGMLGLEAELSKRFTASVLENQRLLRRWFAGVAVLFACLAGLVLVFAQG